MMLNRISSQDDYNSLASTSPSSSSSLECLHDDECADFEDLNTIEVIAEAKATIYLVYSTKPKGYYALKAFLWDNQQPDGYFLREIRFQKFRHPNLVSIHHYVIDHQTESEDNVQHMSFLIMEHAMYGDMFSALIKHKIHFEETIIRTYFHQLIEGLEFLHSNGAAHLDVKLENLLLGKEFVLKLADFDLSYLPEDGKVQTTGTKNFRAPEILHRTSKNPQAADIYSAGLVLFLLKTGGNLPYLEDNFGKEGDLSELKEKNVYMFWEKHCQLLQKDLDFFDPGFKNLFETMTEFDPEKRITMSEIKNSEWYKGPVCSRKELAEYMKDKFDC